MTLSRLWRINAGSPSEWNDGPGLVGMRIDLQKGQHLTQSVAGERPRLGMNIPREKTGLLIINEAMESPRHVEDAMQNPRSAADAMQNPRLVEASSSGFSNLKWGV